MSRNEPNKTILVPTLYKAVVDHRLRELLDLPVALESARRFGDEYFRIVVAAALARGGTLLVPVAAWRRSLEGFTLSAYLDKDEDGEYVHVLEAEKAAAHDTGAVVARKPEFKPLAELRFVDYDPTNERVARLEANVESLRDMIRSLAGIQRTSTTDTEQEGSDDTL